MSVYILDTDILSLLQDGHATVRARVAARNPGELAITILTVEEQLSGWYRQLRRAKKPEQQARIYDRFTATVQSLARLQVLSFSVSAILRAKVLLSSKLGVRKTDLCIAAIALEQNATVVTRNVRDFQQVPSLIVEDWSK